MQLFKPVGCSKCQANCPNRRLAIRCGPESTSSESNWGPTGAVIYGGRLPSRRRAVLGALGGLSIALGGNLGGMTSALLGFQPELAARLKLDVLLPVAGHKRCYDPGRGFEFTYPASWLADQTLAARAARREERARALMLPPGRVGEAEELLGGRAGAQQRQMAARGREVIEPVVAFGPPGTSGEENVSVVVAPITQGFTLESMGPPSLAAGWFLSTIAPQGSGRTATLLSADERTDTSNTRYYCMEYALEFPSKQPGVNITRHNVSVFATTGDRLYTFNAQCSEVDWPKEAAALTAAAASFRLLPP